MVVSRARHQPRRGRSRGFRDMRPGLKLAAGAAIALSLFTGGCMKGPVYQRPTAPVPAAFKEPPPAGWKEAQPSDGVLRGKWWELYNDPVLNALEEQVSISNQNVL